MKTTRILGLLAGVTAVVAAVAVGIGFSPVDAKLGTLSLLAGLGVMAVSFLLGVVHLLLRIWFRNPYSSRRPKPFLMAGRVLVWVWLVLMVALSVYLAVQFGPILLALLSSLTGPNPN